jgi:hypothetical protein
MISRPRATDDPRRDAGSPSFRRPWWRRWFRFRNTFDFMTDDDPWAGLRRWHRREYLRQHEKQRCAGLKAEGARRTDITLRGKALDDYATVRRYVEGLNQLIAEREIKQPPLRLSDTEIIKMALSYARRCGRSCVTFCSGLLSVRQPVDHRLAN